MPRRLSNQLRGLWHASPPLVAAGVVMLVALVVSAAGLALDPRTIAGAPAWLKPAKFAASIAIYTLTLAWIFTFLPAWTVTRRVTGWTTAAGLVFEVALIDMQAWRGTTSHFNIGTTFDAAVFATMGTVIVVQTLTMIAVAVALWRQRFVDEARGWALRLGVSITIAGALSGGVMTRPTAEQLADARTTGRMPIVGAHTVGAPDGTRGLPITGWSRNHGDLRLPHFVGLHAMQILPLVAALAGRRRPNDERVRLTFACAASYLSLFAILVWQALRGQSVIQPDASTAAVLAAWLLVTIALRSLTARRGDTVAPAAVWSGGVR